MSSASVVFCAQGWSMSSSWDRSAVLRRFFGCLVVSFAMLCCAIPAHARSWRIARFDAAITIDRDGHALVTEKLGLRFEGEYHGIHRRIPIHYPGPSGTSFTLFIDAVNVTDGETHQPLRFDDHRSGDYRELTIYIPAAVDA